MSEENKRLVRRFSDEVFARWSVGAVDELVSPDFVNHTVFPGQSPDREGIKQAAAMFRSAFPRWELSEEGIVAEGDHVVFWGTGRGIQEGEFMGVPATRKEISIPGSTSSGWPEGRSSSTSATATSSAP